MPRTNNHAPIETVNSAEGPAEQEFPSSHEYKCRDRWRLRLAHQTSGEALDHPTACTVMPTHRQPGNVSTVWNDCMPLQPNAAGEL